MTEKEFKQKWESFLTNGYVRKDASEHEYHRVWKDILDTFQTIRAESERQGEQNDKLVPILIEYIEKKNAEYEKYKKEHYL